MSTRRAPLTPAQQVDRVLRLCEANGCTLTRQGSAWRIRGPHTDTLVVDLRVVAADDFTAPKPRREV